MAAIIDVLTKSSDYEYLNFSVLQMQSKVIKGEEFLKNKLCEGKMLGQRNGRGD